MRTPVCVKILTLVGENYSGALNYGVPHSPNVALCIKLHKCEAGTSTVSSKDGILTARKSAVQAHGTSLAVMRSASVKCALRTVGATAG